MNSKISGDKKTLAILVHGINTKDPNDSVVGKLDNFFQAYGVDTHILSYGWTEVFGPAFENPRVASELSAVLHNLQEAKLYEEVWLVGHSNGCAIINLCAINFGIPDIVTKAAFIAPALDADRIPVPSINGTCYVYWNQHDTIGKLAELASKLSPSQVYADRPWGDMACKGYSGKAGYVKQYNLNDPDWPHTVVGRKPSLYGPMIVRDMLGIESVSK